MKTLLQIKTSFQTKVGFLSKTKWRQEIGALVVLFKQNIESVTYSQLLSLDIEDFFLINIEPKCQFQFPCWAQTPMLKLIIDGVKAAAKPL